MKILYIHQYFKTPEEGGSIRSYYLASGLVENGYEVEMITTHNRKEYLKREINGIKVHYLPIYYDNHLSVFGRLIAFFKFYHQAIRLAGTIKSVGLVYAMTTPLTVGFIALRLKQKFNLPYYFEVGDLWPKAPIDMGYVKFEMLKKWLYRCEKKIYQNAEKIVALSPSIRNYIERIVPDKKVYLIPNMADVELFNPGKKEEQLGKFIISYFGAVGKANHLEYLLEIAGLCKVHLPQVHFRVMGYGSELDRLKALADQTNLANMDFLDYGSKQQVVELLESTDAVYVSFANYDVLNTGSPNKFFDGLAAGKLVIINFEGWLREVIETHECGFYYDPEYPEEFVGKIETYLADSEALKAAQSNAREIAEMYYSRDLQLKKLLKLLNNEHRLDIIDSEVYILTA